MSIQSEIDRINQAKTDLATAIESKGVTVPPNTTINVYPGLVQQIEQGAGLPSGGTPGQMLYQGESGPEWGDKPVMYVTFTPGSGNYITPSKSGDEIYQAVQDGYAVFAVFGVGMQTLIPLQRCAPNTALFFSITSEMALMNINISETFGVYMIANLSEEVAPKRVTVTLPASGWSSNTQTVTVNGVLADESAQLIQPMPAIASQAAYYAAGILCTGQAANQLSFTCSTTPTEDISLYVVLTEVQS